MQYPGMLGEWNKSFKGKGRFELDRFLETVLARRTEGITPGRCSV